MIVKHLSDIIGTEDDVDTPNWNARRLLLRKDGWAFRFTIPLLNQALKRLFATKITLRLFTASKVKVKSKSLAGSEDISDSPWHDVRA